MHVIYAAIPCVVKVHACICVHNPALYSSVYECIQVKHWINFFRLYLFLQIITWFFLLIGKKKLTLGIKVFSKYTSTLFIYQLTIKARPILLSTCYESKG